MAFKSTKSKSGLINKKPSYKGELIEEKLSRMRNNFFKNSTARLKRALLTEKPEETTKLEEFFSFKEPKK